MVFHKFHLVSYVILITLLLIYYTVRKCTEPDFFRFFSTTSLLLSLPMLRNRTSLYQIFLNPEFHVICSYIKIRILCSSLRNKFCWGIHSCYFSICEWIYVILSRINTSRTKKKNVCGGTKDATELNTIHKVNRKLKKIITNLRKLEN